MKTKKPKVAILTSLVDFSPAYSLCGIILDQARMLKRAGYDYDLLVLKNFNQEHAKEVEAEGLSIKYVLPQTRLVDYDAKKPPEETRTDGQGNVVKGFEEQAAYHREGDPSLGTTGYRYILSEYDTIITHDLMFLSWHLVQNKAIRDCIEMFPEKNWLHWVHSGPSSPPDGTCYPTTLRYSAAPHSTYVYLNYSHVNEYALMIKATKKTVRTVYNPKDVREVWGFDTLTHHMIDEYNLLDHQILQVYPFSTPRWRDKGIKQLLRIFGFWKKQKVKAKLVLVNAHCNSSRDKPEVEAIENYAKMCGLELDEDVILTARFADQVGDKMLRYTVPFRTVRELVMISNMFIFPSISECCSLIQAEASMAGKFMVLNRDFRPMLEFCTEGVLNYEFTRNNPDANPAYYECVAREIWANLQHESTVMNRTKAITQTYNRDWVFENQLEPLLYLGFSKHVEPGPRREPAAPPVIEMELESPSGKIIPMRVGGVRKGPLDEQTILDHIEAVTETEAPIDTVLGVGRVGETGEVMEEVPVPLGIEAELAGKVDGGSSSYSLTPPPTHKNAVHMLEGRLVQRVDYNDPFEGMECSIFGHCTTERKRRCYAEAGHCLILDEIQHEANKEAAK